MKLSWLRLIVSAVIVLASLSGAVTGFAAPAAHDCASMSAMDQCPDHADDHASLPRHCDSLVCGALQITPPTTFTPLTLSEVGAARFVFEDEAHLGQSTSPDLRPPIF
jgi:hypothetical protein